MTLYFLIYFNSMQAAFLLAMRSENAWFAALYFGNYNMFATTLAAFIGSSLGMLINYAIGFYVSGWRENLPIYDDESYEKIARYFRNKLYYLMAVPPILILELMPGIGLFALVNGMFRVPPHKAIAAVAVSRFLYYLYYLSYN